MDTSCILLLVAFCFGAAFVQRVSGFGFGIFIMTILPSIMPSYGEATTLSGILAASQSIIIAISMRRYISWRNLIPILITFVIVSYFAIQFITAIEDEILKRILGIILIATSIYFFLFSDKIHVKANLPIQVSMGTLSGLMGGLFAMQGPPAVLYFTASERDKENYIATTQVYFLIGNIMMTIFRAQNGYLTLSVGIGYAYAICAAYMGNLCGKMIFDKISSKTLRKIIYAFIAISGIVALIR